MGKCESCIKYLDLELVGANLKKLLKGWIAPCLTGHRWCQWLELEQKPWLTYQSLTKKIHKEESHDALDVSLYPLMLPMEVGAFHAFDPPFYACKKYNNRIKYMARRGYTGSWRWRNCWKRGLSKGLGDLRIRYLNQVWDRRRNVEFIGK